MNATDQVSGDWPTFELVQLGATSDVPEEVVDRLRVPRGLIGLEYRVRATADRLGGSLSHLVAFGSCGLRGQICIDTRTLAVVHVPDPVENVVHPVNSDIDRFSRSVEAVISSFPFYGEDDDLEEREAVATGIRTTLLSIDPLAIEHHSFWATFVDDLIVGDYATEEIVAA